MDNRTFGYARVSSREQHEDRQIEALSQIMGSAEIISLWTNAPAKTLSVRATSI